MAHRFRRISTASLNDYNGASTLHSKRFERREKKIAFVIVSAQSIVWISNSFGANARLTPSLRCKIDARHWSTRNSSLQQWLNDIDVSFLVEHRQTQTSLQLQRINK